MGSRGSSALGDHLRKMVVWVDSSSRTMARMLIHDGPPLTPVISLLIPNINNRDTQPIFQDCLLTATASQCRELLQCTSGCYISSIPLAQLYPHEPFTMTGCPATGRSSKGPIAKSGVSSRRVRSKSESWLNYICVAAEVRQKMIRVDQ